jgi:hypothetical protein
MILLLLLLYFTRVGYLWLFFSTVLLFVIITVVVPDIVIIRPTAGNARYIRRTDFDKQQISKIARVCVWFFSDLAPPYGRPDGRRLYFMFFFTFSYLFQTYQRELIRLVYAGAIGRRCCRRHGGSRRDGNDNDTLRGRLPHTTNQLDF